MEAISCDNVPKDIDRTSVYRAPLQISFANCKVNRPKGHAQSSKVKSYTKGLRLLFNCRGSYFCRNTSCINLQDFGVNRRDFVKNQYDEMICSLCSLEVVFVPCEA